DFAGIQGRRGMVVLQRHRGVNVDEARGAFLFALIAATADQTAGELAHQAEQDPVDLVAAVVVLLALDVLERRLDEDLDLALLDVERRRAELAFAADDVALLEAAA